MSLFSYVKKPLYKNKKPLTPVATKAGWAVHPAASGTRYGEVVVAIKNLLVKQTSIVFPTFTAAQTPTVHLVTGGVLNITVASSVAVKVSGVPTIALTIGTGTGVASYNAASSTPTSLVFTYTVLAGDYAATQITIANTIVEKAGYSITVAVPAQPILSEKVPVASLTFVAITASGVTVN